MSRRAQFLEVLGIPTEWISRRPPAAAEGGTVEADLPTAMAAEPEEPAETISVSAQTLVDMEAVGVVEVAEAFAEPLPPAVVDLPVIAPVSDRAAAIAAMDWPTLDAAVAACEACGLCSTRTNTVFGVGDREAEWMLIGEAPGENEDLQGEPFVGQAGKLLDNMLASLGLRRGRNVFIANVLKCRPPGNRNPEPAEVDQCEPFLKRQIALVRPKVIVVLGRFAAQSLLRTTTPIGKLRGTVHSYEGIPVVVTYHPAYLLRTLTDKARAWEDLCLAREVHDRAGAQA
ncbi:MULTISPECIES: uracil-DNA glycosylase [Cupriavidus]|uniref:Type-4 uracil-DNA glycosylase n=1 Tax=Cupriavidus pinatubonensis (strain JMP 134 / LMG 1197) TaxID=264198 RepID=Q46ZY1_CUPPJ|nr:MULTISPECIES: uracil-DNA glycosylase [Cupriavidus]QYY30143.1 uracil-DNA glycosylase [Cupriavidus pinatubonensis]